MNELPYDYNTIAFIFFHINGTERAPTASRIQRLADQLFEDYDELLEQHLPNFGIPLTSENKEIILLLAETGKLAEPDLSRVIDACNFFNDSEMEGFTGDEIPPHAT